MGFKKSRAFDPAGGFLKILVLVTINLMLEGTAARIHLPSITDSENRFASSAPKCLYWKAKTDYRR